MLRNVIVKAPFYSVGAGIVGLSAAQAKTRAHNLKPVKTGNDGAGEYEIVNPIQFKRGEVFGFGGERDKFGAIDEMDPQLSLDAPPASAAAAKPEPPARKRRPFG
jgi:hypothetical protein